jgi:hypothetical protein
MGAGEGQLGLDIVGMRYFIAFTNDSNIINAFASVLVCAFAFNNIIEGKDEMPGWLNIFRIITASAVGLTFVTTALFLAPIEVMLGNSYFLLFSGGTFFLHFFNPVASILSLMFLERGKKFTAPEVFLGLIPTVVYSIVYGLCVMAFKVWDDFYGFTLGGRYYLVPVVYVVIYSATFLISFLIRKVHNRVIDSEGEKNGVGSVQVTGK